MSDDAGHERGRRPRGPELPRVVGVHEGDAPGTTVVVIGGMHGNEPAGTLAARQVLDELSERKPSFAGRLVCVTGNRRALTVGQRFLERDLNRRWFESDIAALRLRSPARDSVEDGEQRELVELFEEILASADRPAVFLDLHSTSGEGPPFACMSDTRRNRGVALALPLPIILGLEEVIDGAMLGYLSDLGHCGVAVEGGQHDDPRSVDQHVAAIWIVLVTAGVIAPSDVPQLAAHEKRLERASRDTPRVVEIRHRHVVYPEDDFIMEPGFRSFDPIEKGQLLARDRQGEIHATESGRVLLPRYQGQGEDGFFIVRDVRPFWLTVSDWLLRLRLDRLVPLLPGVSRHPAGIDRLVVDPKVARWYAVELMHLCGYRRRQPEGDLLVFSRRRSDSLEPSFLTHLGRPAPAGE